MNGALINTRALSAMRGKRRILTEWLCELHRRKSGIQELDVGEWVEQEGMRVLNSAVRGALISNWKEVSGISTQVYSRLCSRLIRSMLI